MEKIMTLIKYTSPVSYTRSVGRTVSLQQQGIDREEEGPSTFVPGFSRAIVLSPLDPESTLFP